MPPLVLGETEAHLWCVSQDEVTDPELIRHYEGLLAPEEAAQRQRLVRAEHRHEYLVTRALCRTTLSRYADVEPSAWQFERNRHGRPEIFAPRDIPPLRFNLSNTSGMVVCLVTLQLDAGVDVEDTTRERRTVSVAERFFAPEEVAALHALPPEQQAARFFEYWTLKEAFIKARGQGLSLPLKKFAFDLDGGGPITVSFAPELDDDPARWQFAFHRISERHLIATAIKSGDRADVGVVVKRVVPESKID